MMRGNRNQIVGGLIGALISSALLLGYATTLRADAPEKKAKVQDKDTDASSDALDRELLEDLEDDLADDVDSPAVKAGGDKTKPKARDAEKPRDTIDEELLRDLDLGEDIELGPDGEPVEDDELGGETDPLTRIGRKMRAAEALVGKTELTEKTRTIQDEIVSDIDALIQELLKRQQQQQASKSKKPRPGTQARRPKVRQPSRRKPGSPGNRESRKPARDSEDRRGKPKRPEIDMAELNELLKDIWGHLPEKDREQLRQSSVESFLPKYELLIEKYFRRLAEETEESP